MASSTYQFCHRREELLTLPLRWFTTPDGRYHPRAFLPAACLRFVCWGEGERFRSAACRSPPYYFPTVLGSGGHLLLPATVWFTTYHRRVLHAFLPALQFCRASTVVPACTFDSTYTTHATACYLILCWPSPLPAATFCHVPAGRSAARWRFAFLHT